MNELGLDGPLRAKLRKALQNDPEVVPPSGLLKITVAALLGLIKLVVIDLDDVDDAQVIFEALNARNTPLSALAG